MEDPTLRQMLQRIGLLLVLLGLALWIAYSLPDNITAARPADQPTTHLQAAPQAPGPTQNMAH